MGPAVTRGIIAAALSLGAAGCGDEPDAGRAALEELFDRPLPPETELLAYVPPAGGIGGAWMVFSPASLPVPDRATAGEAPAAAVLTAAAAMGADAAGIGTPRDELGTLREWTADEMTVRIRSVGTDRGTLSHVETWPR